MDDDRGNDSSNSGDGSDFEMITQTTQPSQTQSQTQPSQSQSGTQVSQPDDGEAGGESKAGSKSRPKEVRKERGVFIVFDPVVRMKHDGPRWPHASCFLNFSPPIWPLGNSTFACTTFVLVSLCVSCLAFCEAKNRTHSRHACTFDAHRRAISKHRHEFATAV